MADTFIPNPGFATYLEHAPLLLVALEAKAKEIEAKAKEIAPVGDPADDDHPGEYRDSIKGEAGFDEKGKIVGRVNAYAGHSGFVEFGVPSRGIEAHAVLRRASEGGSDAEGGGE